MALRRHIKIKTNKSLITESFLKLLKLINIIFSLQIKTFITKIIIIFGTLNFQTFY